MSPSSNWEYRLLHLTTSHEIKNVEDALNDMGRQGWELITAYLTLTPTSSFLKNGKGNRLGTGSRISPGKRDQWSRWGRAAKQKKPRAARPGFSRDSGQASPPWSWSACARQRTERVVLQRARISLVSWASISETGMGTRRRYRLAPGHHLTLGSG